MTEALRLVLTQVPLPTTASNGIASFIACLESTGDFVVKSHKPLVDGARELLEHGFDPATLLTMRHAGSSHDSFQPRPIGDWAKVTYEETAKRGPRSVRWIPRPVVGERQKSGSEPSADGWWWP